MLQTEYEFTLPKGYADPEGNIHRRGIMRLATALDEIEAARAPGVKANADYMPVILLSRVVTRLEGVERVTPEVVEKLFTADFAFLQNMYETINNVEEPMIQVQCPCCGKSFTDTLNFALGE
ncbi:MAG: hypothetical protein NC420_10910 [Eubacterium sp.]|nr:hypothetical protein [Eubacterium sp.]MCM1213092.1 hypothetical protein [Lachnospiraceae bacterium]MCM1239399.1 hypothetical protein [Lachnospiraceae bacterium]